MAQKVTHSLSAISKDFGPFLTSLNTLFRMTHNMFFSALFLVDAEHCVYLWQGWFPVVNSNTESNDDSNIVTTG